MKNPKVMIGVITYDKQFYCRKAFIKSLEKLTYPDVEFIFVTNSGEDDAKDLDRRMDVLRQHHTVTILIDKETPKDKFQLIANGRNMIIEHFLASKAEWIHFIDSDVIAPANRIEVFLSDKKDLITGWYLSYFKNKNGKKCLMPVVYGYKKGHFCRQMTIPEVLPPRLGKVVTAGAGLFFAHRKVLEQVKFTVDPKGKTGEDTRFFKECAEKGFQLWLDTRIKGWHIQHAVGDKRNNVYDPRRYRTKKPDK